jgi:hypothetical protein
MDWRLVRHLLQGRLVVRSRPLPGRSTWPPRRLTGEPARWWLLILHPPQISQRPARVSTPLSPEVSGRCLSATCDRHSCEPQDAVAVRIRASALELVWLPMPGNEMGPPLAGVGYIYSRRGAALWDSAGQRSDGVVVAVSVTIVQQGVRFRCGCVLGLSANLSGTSSGGCARGAVHLSVVIPRHALTLRLQRSSECVPIGFRVGRVRLPGKPRK